MTTRREVLAALGFSPFLASRAAWAQPARRIPRIGVLHPGFAPPAPLPVAVRLLREGLRSIGYIEDKTIDLELRYGAGKPETLPGQAAELVRAGVDVLVVFSPAAVVAARQATTTIPIVASDLESDPVAAGFVASLSRPGGNVTGVFLDLPDLAGKWLQLAREVRPGARRVAALWDANTGALQSRAISLAAKTMSVDLRVLEFRQASEIQGALDQGLKHKPEFLIQLSSPLINQLADRIAEFSTAHRLPAISMFRPFPEAGGLMSYGPDLTILFQRVAAYVDKILKGAKPAGMPVERPTNFELIVNLRTAKTLGLKLPETILVRADKVIE